MLAPVTIVLVGAGLSAGAVVAQAEHETLNVYPGTVLSLRDPRTDMIVYVETNGRTLVGLTANGDVAWRVDAPAATGSAPEPPVRSLRLDGEKLWVVRGKSEAFTINSANGRLTAMGSD